MALAEAISASSWAFQLASVDFATLSRRAILA
jgi:hypothetical protein